ncbi:alpha-1,3-glucosyltransferase [Klebsormidium nitens]|uniref:Alpha-1,3-glucosyltransferase n=1 Tax=Klebsormidium nitens TaxID=105231 RepID=A0A1Y1ITU5_KLENI|nr:alpha-1,3-glucosyltransferase [Klebsormidium nitens]|eukprot:GAQ91618.1 alpha-1,3-glucosyltransferase [Klebsormidium nitens]
MNGSLGGLVGEVQGARSGIGGHCQGARMAPSILWIALAVTCLKLLLVPSYHSTDFEVHRNWLAITHSLPVKQWYLDETSPWTLDYPPLFAWFQKLLALPAPLVDPLIVDVKKGLEYDAPMAVLYMRATVMLSDVLLFFAVHNYACSLPASKRALAAGAVIFSPGLIMVDHIHFQYNGVLLGLLILSIGLIKSGRDVLGGVLFASLLCSKHLFMVAGPVYFVYLLRHYCRGPRKFVRFVVLAASVLSVIGAAFGPFVYYKQIPQVMLRLFPFGRGLTHAYWAPNAWALYNSADKVMSVVARKMGLRVAERAGALTGGLVGESGGHVVLPEVTPLLTALLVLLSLLPCLVRIWRNPRPSEFLRCVAYSYLCGFMFGWHVHEKAILTAVVPLALLAVESPEEAGRYFFLSTVAHFSLLPLLFEPREYPIKVLLTALYCLATSACLQDHFSGSSDNPQSSEPKTANLMSAKSPDRSEVTSGWPEHDAQVSGGEGTEARKQGLLTWLERGYLIGLVFVELYASWVHPALLGGKLPFLPLMLVSTYCALGIAYAWVLQLRLVARTPSKQSMQ